MNVELFLKTTTSRLCCEDRWLNWDLHDSQWIVVRYCVPKHGKIECLHKGRDLEEALRILEQGEE